MSAQEKSEVLARVEETKWGKRKLLAQLQVPRSTYYRWRARERQGKQECLNATTACSGSPRTRPFPPDLSLTKVSHFCWLPTRWDVGYGEVGAVDDMPDMITLDGDKVVVPILDRESGDIGPRPLGTEFFVGHDPVLVTWKWRRET